MPVNPVAIALMDGQPVALPATVSGTGVVAPTFTYNSAQARRTLAVAAVQAGGTGSTVTTQLQASLDGTNFFNVGSAMALGGSTAANGATASVDGLMGATLRLNVTAYTAGTGVTGVALSLLLG